MSTMRFAYQRLLKPLLFRFDPEAVHDVFVSAGEMLGRSAPTRWAVGRLYDYRGPDVSRTVDGIEYRTPVLLAAGFDYNARLVGILGSVGFGGVEVGSVTARPSPGNPPPRLRRAVRSRALLVYKGLRNDGVDRLIQRLRRRPPAPGLVLGISIAMTNDEGSATIEGAIDDYCTSFRKLNEAGLGDYYTINISCPNVYCGENFTTPERLRQLLERLREIPTTRPCYAKMPINLPWDEFRGLLDIVREFGLSGVVIGNLNKDYSTLECPEELPSNPRGKLSGRPCFAPSNDLIRRTREHCGPGFTIVGCGGIMSAGDAIAKLRAGADLLQLITGMIFEGPHLMRNIARELALHPELLRPQRSASTPAQHPAPAAAEP